MLLQDDPVQVGGRGLLGGGATWQDLALGAGLGLLSNNGDPRGLMQGLQFGNQLGQSRRLSDLRDQQMRKADAEMRARERAEQERAAAIDALPEQLRPLARVRPELIETYAKNQGAARELLPAEKLALAAQGADPASQLGQALAAELSARGVTDGFRYGPDGAAAVAGGPADPRYRAGVAGAETTARQSAEMPFVGPRAAASASAQLPSQMRMAQFNSDLQVREAFARPRQVSPSTIEITGGGPGGEAPRETFRNPMAVQEGAFAAELGKEQREVVSEARAAAGAASQAIPSLLSQKNLIDKGFQTGFGTQTRAAVSTALQGLGVPEGMSNALTRGDPAALRLFQANSNEIVQQIARSMGANPTDNDARLLAQTIAQATDAPSAAKAIIDYRLGRERGKVEKWQSLADWTLRDRKDPLLFDVEWSRRLNSATPAAAGLPGNAADLSQLSNDDVLRRLGIR